MREGKTGWFGLHDKKIDSMKGRGNFCFKVFERSDRNLTDIETICGRFSSKLLTHCMLNNEKSTLKYEAEYIMSEKLFLKRNDKNKIFGITPQLEGKFLFFKNIFIKNMKKSNFFVGSEKFFCVRDLYHNVNPKHCQNLQEEAREESSTNSLQIHSKIQYSVSPW